MPLLGFGVICLITAFILTFIGNSRLFHDSVSARGGIIGPMTIQQAGTILDIDVNQSLPVNHWSFVSLSLLDKDMTWLMGFGGEFWHEKGYDSEGYYWNESDRKYDATITIPKAGTYYFQVKPESNMTSRQTLGNKISISVDKQGYSSIPHMAAGIIAIVLAFIFSWLGRRNMLDALKES